MLFNLALTVLTVLVLYSVLTYLYESGTPAQRIAAAWQHSLTKFALVWTTIASVLWNALNMLADITGDPQFAHAGEAIKSAVTPQMAQYITIGTILAPLVLGWIARNRTPAVGAK